MTVRPRISTKAAAAQGFQRALDVIAVCYGERHEAFVEISRMLMQLQQL
jgi:hypothetical protein